MNKRESKNVFATILSEWYRSQEHLPRLNAREEIIKAIMVKKGKTYKSAKIEFNNLRSGVVKFSYFFLAEPFLAITTKYPNSETLVAHLRSHTEGQTQS